MKKALYILFSAAMLSLLSLRVSSSNGYPEAELLTNNNFGTEFYLSIPPTHLDANIGNSKVYFYINSFVKTNVKISVPAKGYSIESEASPERITELALSPEYAQIYLKYPFSPSSQSEFTGDGAVLIESESPISVYVMIKYDDVNEGFVALPTHVIGQEYIIESYPHGSAKNYYFKNSTSTAAIIAPYENTIVKFILGGNDLTSVSKLNRKGDTLSRILNKGDVWVVNTESEGGDLSGSRIVATMPIAVIAGNQCAGIPVNSDGCGYLVEMLYPIESWGKHFALPQLLERKKAPVIRIFSKHPNTDLWLKGQLISTLNSDESDNFIDLRLDDYPELSDGFIVASNPAHAMMYNTSPTEEKDNYPSVEPFMMNLIPTEQFSNEVLFHIPVYRYGKKYDEVRALIMIKSQDGKIPDDIQYCEPKVNDLVWEKLPANRVLKIDTIFHDGGEPAFFTIYYKLKEFGVVRLKSQSPFAVYLYGYLGNESFGFPAYARINRINSGDTEAPMPSYSMHCGGRVLGKIMDMPNADALRSNLSAPFIQTNDTNYWYNYNWKFERITPGITREATWSLEVDDPNRDAKATIMFKDMAGNDTTITIFYDAPEYMAESSRISFGSIEYDFTASRDLIILNKSPEPLLITKFKFLKGNQGFSVNSDMLPIEIAAMSSATVPITFHATAAGAFKDSIGIETECRFKYIAELEAWSGNPVIEVSDINFGDIEIGSHITKPAFIKNSGNSDLVITGFSDLNDDALALQLNAVITKDKPLVLKPDAKHDFEVIINPNSVKNISTALVFFSNAKKIDSICQISARSIEKGIIAGSYTWGRQLINRNDFPTGPYSGEIVIKNKYPHSIKIKNVTHDDESNSFFYNRFDIIDKEIMPEDSIVLKVSFSPPKAAEFRSILEIIDTKGNRTNAYLTGTGVVPKSTVSIDGFDTIMVNDKSGPVVRDIVITNLSTDEWEYATDLTVYGVKSAIEGEIAINGDYSDMGFRVIHPENLFPATLRPGESLKLRALYRPIKAGLSKSELIVNDNSLASPKRLIMSGFAVDNQISLLVGSAEACFNHSVIISNIIKNNGTMPVEIDKIEFSEFKQDFSFDNPNDTEGFTLLPKSEKTIKVKFRPTAFNPQSVGLLVKGKNGENLFDEAKITATTAAYRFDVLSTPLSASIDPGKKFEASIIVQTDEDVIEADVHELYAVLEYDSRAMRYIENSLEIGSLLSGKFRIHDLNVNNSAGQIYFWLSTINGERIEASGELFNLDFDTYQPAENIHSATLKLSLTTPGNTCTDLKVSSSIIKLNELCAGDVARFGGSPIDFDLIQVIHNNTGGTLDISYAIGYESFTTIEIFDLNGNVVATPLSGSVKSGIHNISLNPINMASGVYQCRMTTGHLSRSKKFLIVK